MIATAERSDVFACFGAQCAVFVGGASADSAVAHAKRRLLAWHDQFTRFAPASELSRLNADPRSEVPVSPMMARFVDAVVAAAELTGGLVDATLLDDLVDAGYDGDLGLSIPLDLALAMADDARRPAGPSPRSRWREIELTCGGRAVRRPPGVRLDSGGLVKGLFADVLAESLERYDCFAVDCAGDLRIGGTPREVRVASPFDESVLLAFELGGGGIATSGIGARSWLLADGSPAHHLLDPRTRRPAYTGVVQATALAPSALEAEIRAKAALLGGPSVADRWLPHGGVVVLEDGSFEVVAPTTN